jgi:hypothetical protein
MSILQWWTAQALMTGSEPQRHCRLVRQAEDRGRIHHMESRHGLAIDQDVSKPVIRGRKWHHRAKQNVLALK